MSSYSYGPPPPPPSANPGGYGHPSGPYANHSSGRGGGQQHGRGRGGHYGGRGDHHGAPPPHYEYGQQPYHGHQQPPAQYAGSLPQPHSYQQPPPQWSSEHGHAQQHHHPHAPQPLSAANYHPNYAPQAYPQTSQYPPQQQQPTYSSAQQYGPSYPGPSPPNVSHWSGQPPSQPPAYVGSRGRGGYSDRGGPKAHHGGPRQGRPGYEHEQVPPVAHGSYSQPYPHDPRANHYPPQPYAYAAPPPPPEPSVRHEPYYVQPGHNRRGRGGREQNGRGRGGHHGRHHGADKAQHQPRKPSHQENGQQKKVQEAPAGGKKKKRKTNTLGLTPGNDSETEDDEGEEKMLTDLIGKEAVIIKDVAAYIAERKKHFPTRARVEAKKAAELARTDEDKAAVLERQADKLRKQLRKVESSIKRKREQGDEGDEMRDSSPEESSDDEKPEVMSSKSPKAPALPPPAKKADITKHCKYYSTGGSCGKKGKCRFRHDPEVREAAMREREANNGRLTIQQRLILNDKDQEDLTVLQSIQYLREKGLMTATDADVKDETPDIAAKPVLQGKPEVKGDVEEGAKPEVEPTTKSQAQPATSSLLPAAPPSLPAPPAKRESISNKGGTRHNPPPPSLPGGDNSSAKDVKHYQGWLLKPYGGKSDDLP